MATPLELSFVRQSCPRSEPTQVSSNLVLGLTGRPVLTMSPAFAVNMPDVTRYSKSPRGAAISQAVLLPVVITLGKSVTVQGKKNHALTNSKVEILGGSPVTHTWIDKY